MLNFIPEAFAYSPVRGGKVPPALFLATTMWGNILISIAPIVLVILIIVVIKAMKRRKKNEYENK